MPDFRACVPGRVLRLAPSRRWLPLPLRTLSGKKYACCGAKKQRNGSFNEISNLVSEYVFLGPSGQVELGPGGEESEARLGQLAAPFPDQHLVELGAQRMQM